jgi:hypothetical protein
MRQSDDPGTREAIRSLAEIGDIWTGGGSAVSKFLDGSAHQYWEVRDAEVNRRFNAASVLYLKAMPPSLIGSIRSDFIRGLFRNDVPEQAYFPIQANSWLFDMVETSPENLEWHVLSRARSFNPADRPWLEGWRHAPYLRIYRNVSPAWIFAVAVIIAIAAVVKNPAVVRKSALALALIVSSVVAFLLNMIMVYYMSRFAMPMYAMGLAAVFLSISALVERQPPNRTG